MGRFYTNYGQFFNLKSACTGALMLIIFWQTNGQVSMGRVVDESSMDPLPLATVAFLNTADSSLISGMTTDLDGYFDLEVLRDSFLVEVTYVGYVPAIYPMNTDKLAGRDTISFFMFQDTEMLAEVTIEGVQSMFRSDIDKRVYAVENSIVAQGGNAIDVLQTLPSIQVDENGGVSMRGSGNILILINGRPSTVSTDDTESILSQFPASSIKSIELITNPSSRYDAAGVGGIINIILKEDRRRGVNTQVELGIGTRQKYNAGVQINYAGPKWRIFGNYNYTFRSLFELSESIRFSNDELTSARLIQGFDTDNDNSGHLIRTGFEYDLPGNMLIGGTFQVNNSSRNRIRVYNQSHQMLNGNRDSLIIRTLREDQQAINYESTLFYNWAIDSLGQEWSASATYTRNTQARVEFFDEQIFYDQDPFADRLIDQIYGRPDTSSLFIFQTDYLLPINQGSMEAGLKSTYSYQHLYNLFDQREGGMGDFVPNDTVTNQFIFEESVYAAYVMMNQRFGAWSYQAGLRAEWTLNESLETNESGMVRNDYINLFPSIYLGYDVSDKQQLLINYSRRINRPSIWNLAPLYNAQDFLNLRLGNPLLRPEFTDSYEIGYQIETRVTNISATFYHRRTRDVMSRVFLLYDNNNVVQFWENANNRISSGLEVISQFDVTRKMDATLSTNLFYSEIRGENISADFVNSAFSWTVSLLSNYRMGKYGSFQLTGNYRGPIVLPQGTIDPIWGINLGYRVNLLDNKFTLGVNVTDIFNTQIYRITMKDASFDQTRNFNRETQIGNLYARYTFGYMKEQSEERKRDEYGEYPF